MDAVLNKRPSIERLYKSFREFAKDKKGIVYAINISHARSIVQYYQEQGVNVVAIDSKTPAEERKRLIERFKKTLTNDKSSTDDTDIQVLVNVDIFSEGFDCPDVEFNWHVLHCRLPSTCRWLGEACVWPRARRAA